MVAAIESSRYDMAVAAAESDVGARGGVEIDPKLSATGLDPNSKATTVKVQFTPVYGSRHAGGGGGGACCGLLQIDETRLLLDIGWSDTYDVKELEALRHVAGTVHAVLISHPDVDFSGALPYAYAHLGLRVPVYMTRAAQRLARIAAHDALVSLDACAAFEEVTLADVDAAFALAANGGLVRDMRAYESVTVGGVEVEAFPAGRSLGGALWRVSKHSESVVYAVGFGATRGLVTGSVSLTSAARRSSPSARLSRPTLVITEGFQCPSDLEFGTSLAERWAIACGSGQSGSSGPVAQDPRARRRKGGGGGGGGGGGSGGGLEWKSRNGGERLAQVIAGVARQGGDTLIPIDGAARALEIAAMLDAAVVSTGAFQAEIALISAHAPVLVAAGRAEETRGDLRNVSAGAVAEDMSSPLRFRRIHVLSSLSEVAQLSRPVAVLAPLSALDMGFSRVLLPVFAAVPNNAVVFTHIPRPNSLAADLLRAAATTRPDVSAATPATPWGATLQVEITQKSKRPLQGQELRAWEQQQAIRRASQAARARAAKADARSRAREEMEVGESGGGGGGSRRRRLPAVDLIRSATALEVDAEEEAMSKLAGSGSLHGASLLPCVPGGLAPRAPTVAGGKRPTAGVEEEDLQRGRSLAAKVRATGVTYPTFSGPEPSLDLDKLGPRLDETMLSESSTGYGELEAAAQAAAASAQASARGDSDATGLLAESRKRLEHVHVPSRDQDRTTAPMRTHIEQVQAAIHCGVFFISGMDGSASPAQRAFLLSSLQPRKLILAHCPDPDAVDDPSFLALKSEIPHTPILRSRLATPLDGSSHTPVLDTLVAPALFANLRFERVGDIEIARLAATLEENLHTDDAKRQRTDADSKYLLVPITSSSSSQHHHHDLEDHDPTSSSADATLVRSGILRASDIDRCLRKRLGIRPRIAQGKVITPAGVTISIIPPGTNELAHETTVQIDGPFGDEYFQVRDAIYSLHKVL